MKEKTRLVRLTEIQTLLQSKTLITATELAKKFGVSVRTIYRDIRALEESGFPIITEEGKGYSLVEGYRIPPVQFSEVEVNALLTIEQLVVYNGDVSLQNAYKDAMIKIKSVLSHSQKKRLENLSSKIKINSFQINNTSANLILVQQAISNYQLLKINYTSLKDVSTQRDIEPFALYNTNNNWILIAFCRLRNDFRAFRLDCIVAINVKSNFFKPHSLTLEEFFSRYSEKIKPTPDNRLTPSVNTFDTAKQKNIMEVIKREKFTVVGIAIKTSNENNQAMQDIPALWDKFMREGVADQIKNKIDQSIYGVYTDYEGDHTKPYLTLIGCKVPNGNVDVPKGMVQREIQPADCNKFVSKGDATQGAIYNTWTEIWESDLDRAYSADYEVYDERAMNPKDVEVDIFVSVKR